MSNLPRQLNRELRKNEREEEVRMLKTKKRNSGRMYQ